MRHRKTRSIISINNSSKEIRVIPQKNTFINAISKIFSQEPSHSGYKQDIENLINDIGLTEEDYLYLAIESLSKIVRNKTDMRIITSYLYSMPNFIKFFRGNNEGNKTEKEILKDLLNLSRSVTYEKYDKDIILMRFGEIGTTAYLILRGNVNVFIKNFKIMSITKKDYLFYLANLIRYGEYGLFNDVINENFNTFPIELVNNNEQNNENKFTIEKDKKRNNTLQNLEEIPLNNNHNDKNITNLNLFNKTNTEQGEKKNSIKNSNIPLKLNEKNMEMKLYRKPFKISEEKLLELFNMKKMSHKHSHCSFNEYIIVGNKKGK